MQLSSGWHLAYCTNIHRGETWAQTFETLVQYTLRVRDQVAEGRPYAIGLRLGDQAARELSDPAALKDFRRWMDRERCYVFTINGFPYGRFHGTRVKEQVYAPDWTTPERLEYTRRLFDILAEIVPPGGEGSVSTVPCSYKEFIQSPDHERALRDNLFRCAEYADDLSRRSGRDLHLGLEPEPLCYLETSAETIRFFEQLHAEHPKDDRISRRLGVNYDTCHLAVEFEEPREALLGLVDRGIRLSKVHLSSALKVTPGEKVRAALGSFADDIYFHQVIARDASGALQRYRDLDVALSKSPPGKEQEWRIHFHIPLHTRPTELFGNTADHIAGALDILKARPELCRHYEMETYTWEVMPADLKKADVVEQLVAEYRWTLGELSERGIRLV